MTLALHGKEEPCPPFWRVALLAVLVAPLFWVEIAALTSQKALAEFRNAEPIAPEGRLPDGRSES